MIKGADKTRLAIAVFDSDACLCNALANLRSVGFGREQIGIATLTSTLSALRSGALGVALDDGNAADPVTQVETTLTKVDDGFVVVTRGSFWERLGCFGGAASQALGTANWMTLKLRDDLTEYIRKGAIVLGVSARDLDQQRQSTRILLRFSSHRVQTHEFTL